MSPHEWSEQSKRMLDIVAGLASITAIGAAQVAAMVSIAAGLMSILWLAIRIHDRVRYGRGGGE